MRQLLCLLVLLTTQFAVNAQEILVDSPLPFAPFDTIANGKLLVTSLKNVNDSPPLALSCGCKLSTVSIGYLPDRGDYLEFGKVTITNGKFPPNVQQQMVHLKIGDRMFLSDLVFECKKKDCAKNYNIGPISLKVMGR